MLAHENREAVVFVTGKERFGPHTEVRRGGPPFDRLQAACGHNVEAAGPVAGRRRGVPGTEARGPWKWMAGVTLEKRERVFSSKPPAAAPKQHERRSVLTGLCVCQYCMPY